MIALLAALIALLGQAPAPAPGASVPPMLLPPVVLSDPGPGGRRVNEAGVFGNYYPAASDGRAPGVLLLGGSEGGLGAGAARQAQSLAEHGFSVLQLAYFGAPGTPEHLRGVPLEEFDRGLAWLRARPEVDPDRTAMVGTSKGAEAALLAASSDPRLKAVVAASPSAVVFPGIDMTSREMTSSWSRGGADLPFVRYGQPPAGTPGLLYVFTGYRLGFDSLASHPEAVIPLRRAHARVLLLCGDADTLWPSCPMAEALKARAAKGGPSVQLLAYPDAGHAVAGPPVDPSAPGYASLGGLGGTAEGNNAARRDAWPKVLAFLDAALKPAQP